MQHFKSHNLTAIGPSDIDFCMRFIEPHSRGLRQKVWPEQTLKRHNFVLQFI